MNLLIVFVILLVLFVGDADAGQPVDHVWFRLFAIGTTLSAVPMFAMVQTFILTRRLRQDELDDHHTARMLARFSASHSAVWLVSSLLIVFAFQWQHIIRFNWGLNRWPLVDELIILTPILFSLVASWAVFFDVQNARAPKGQPSQFRKRVEFVALRVRVYLLIALVPILFVAFARDCLSPSTFTFNQMLSIGFVIGWVLLAAFPFLMLLVWRTRRIERVDVAKSVNDVCCEFGLRISTTRVWKTENQIVNAVVAGVFPFFRVMVISDALVALFNEQELRAILRHEAGHIRRWHLVSRMVFVLLPLVVLGVCQLMGRDMLAAFQAAMVGLGFAESFALPVVIGSYVIYLLGMLRWLSVQMEYDADLFACVSYREKGDVDLDVERAEAMREALLRFAALNPELVDKKTFWHPSLRARLVRIQRMINRPALAQTYADWFLNQQFVLICGVLLGLTALQIVLRVAGF